MKIWTSVIMIFAMIPLSVSSQQFYLSANGGYELHLAATNNQSINFANQFFDDKNTYRETLDYSLAEGMNFGIDFGYKLNKNIAFEIGLSYLSGNTVEFIHKDKTTIYYEGSLSSSMYRISPTIVISTGNTLLSPYAKFGVVFGIGNIVYTSIQSPDEFELKMSGGIPIGITGALGLDYIISDDFSCFVQISTQNMSYFPEKGEFIKWTVNGKDELPEKSFREKNISFSNRYYPQKDDPNPDPNKPHEGWGATYPFGNLGINFGLKARISGFSFKLKQDNPR